MAFADELFNANTIAKAKVELERAMGMPIDTRRLVNEGWRLQLQDMAFSLVKGDQSLLLTDSEAKMIGNYITERQARYLNMAKRGVTEPKPEPKPDPNQPKGNSDLKGSW